MVTSICWTLKEKSSHTWWRWYSWWLWC